MQGNVPFRRFTAGRGLHQHVGKFTQVGLMNGGKDQETRKSQVPRVAMLEPQIKRGRPLIRLLVNGMICTCFVDTGSEVTILKESACRKLNVMSLTPIERTFKGASGAIFSGQGEVNVHFSIEDTVQCTHPVVVFKEISFPGDVLLSTDFLRRFNFQLVANHTPPRNFMSFNDVRVPFWFSDQTSLGLRFYNVLIPRLSVLFYLCPTPLFVSLNLVVL